MSYDLKLNNTGNTKFFLFIYLVPKKESQLGESCFGGGGGEAQQLTQHGDHCSKFVVVTTLLTFLLHKSY